MRSLHLRSWLLVSCAFAILALAGCGQGNTLYSPTAPTGALSSGALTTDGTPDSLATAADVTDEVADALDKGRKDGKSKDDDEGEDDDQGEDQDDDDDDKDDDKGEDEDDDEGEDDDDDEGDDDKGKGEHDKGKGQTDKGKGQTDKDKGQTDKGKGQTDKDKGQTDKDKGQTDKDKGQNDKGKGQTDAGKGGNDKGGNSADSGTACGRRDKAVGFVTAKSADTLTVRGTSVKAATAARIHHGNRTLAFADIRVGNHVQAYGALSGTTLEACEIKVEDTRRNK